MAMRFIFSQNIINARDRILQDLSLGLEDAEFNFDTFVFDMVDQFGSSGGADIFKFFKTKNQYISLN